MRFFNIATVATVMGLIVVGLAVAESGDLSPVWLVLGYVLLAIGVINFGVHSVAVLMHDHEMWRSSHFTEIIETGDGDQALDVVVHGNRMPYQ